MFKKTGLYAFLIIGALVSVAPYLMTLNSAVKQPDKLLTTPAWEPATSPTFANFSQVWGEYDMSSFLWHTFVVAAVVTVLQVVFSCLAAFAFARIAFPGRELLFWAYVATMMVPQIVTIVPLFLLMRQFDLVDTYPGLILPYVFGFGAPYAIFLVRQYFKTIPVDLESAARIDGASTMTVFTRIMIPLSRPILATLATMTFVNTWNNILWPLIITNSDRTRVIALGIATLKSQYASQYNLVLAAAALALLPLVAIFLAFQRNIIRSIALTGIK
ncbi:carbohydrate ABC transporter permease [Actinocorallia longicatena]